MAIQNLSGLSSGFDWQKLIDLQIQQKSIALQTLSQRKSDLQRKVSSWSSIEGSMNTLKNSANNISSTSGFIAKTATSSNTDTLTIDADSAAADGTHTVLVNQLAQTEVEMHAGWADSDTTAVNTSGANQVFSYTYNGSTVNVTIANNTTLEGLVSAINGDQNNAGITASIVNDGLGGATSYHLVLTGNSTGSTYGISINNAATTLGATNTEFDSGTFTQTQTAQNAKFRVDGVLPAPGWLESENNVVSSVLSGITLHLKAASATAVTISISQDTSVIKSRIRTFVDNYNATMDAIRTLSSYDTENKISGPLFGDGNSSSVKSQLQYIVSSSFEGMPAGSPYTSLASVGITPNGDGQLTINSTTLDEALAADLDNVAALFAFTSSTSNEALSHLAHTGKTVGGEYSVVATYLATGVLDSAGTNTIGGYAATIENGNVLVGADNTPVQGLRIIFNNPGGGPGTVNATVRIGKGAAVQFSDLISTLTDAEEGTTTSAKKQLNSSIDLIDKRAEALQKRINDERLRLQRRYSAAEKLISNLQSQMNQLSAK